jgi:hypothetical protein
MLLGDSAYAISDFLIKPILNVVDPSKIAYTATHCRTRATVERAIGQMKRKFSAMHKELRYELVKCSPIIASCAILHNFAKMRYGRRYNKEEFGDKNTPKMMTIAKVLMLSPFQQTFLRFAVTVKRNDDRLFMIFSPAKHFKTINSIRI